MPPINANVLALVVASLIFTKLVGGYGVDLIVKLNLGLFVAVFRIDWYMNYGYKPVAS
jgi:hypothetical protein